MKKLRVLGVGVLMMRLPPASIEGVETARYAGEVQMWSIYQVGIEKGHQ